MRKTFRGAAVPAVLLPTVLAGVTFAVPTWPESVGLDFWSIPGLQRQVEAEDREAARLAACGESVRRRLQLKEAAIDELLAGQITLLDASKVFLTVIEDAPDAQRMLRMNFRGASDEERVLRQVIHFVCSRMDNDPRVTPAVLETLRRDLDVAISSLGN